MTPDQIKQLISSTPQFARAQNIVNQVKMRSVGLYGFMIIAVPVLEPNVAPGTVGAAGSDYFLQFSFLAIGCPAFGPSVSTEMDYRDVNNREGNIDDLVDSLVRFLAGEQMIATFYQTNVFAPVTPPQRLPVLPSPAPVMAPPADPVGVQIDGPPMNGNRPRYMMQPGDQTMVGDTVASPSHDGKHFTKVAVPALFGAPGPNGTPVQCWYVPQ